MVCMGKKKVLVGGVGAGGIGVLDAFKEFLKERKGMELVGTDVVLEAIIQKGYESLGDDTKVYVSDILKAIELRQRLGPQTGAAIQDKIDKLLNIDTGVGIKKVKVGCSKKGGGKKGVSEV